MSSNVKQKDVLDRTCENTATARITNSSTARPVVRGDVIANAVALADKKYGADARYQEYVKSVPLVLPTWASLSRFVRGSAPPRER